MAPSSLAARSSRLRRLRGAAAAEPARSRAHHAARGRAEAGRRAAAWRAPARPSRRAAASPRSGARARRPPAPRGPARSIACASSGTVSSASTAWPIRSGISSAGTPSASSSPALRLREVGASAVATRSPVPARPTNVRACPPLCRASASTSRKMSAAAMPAAFRPCAWVAPDRHGRGVLRHAGELHPHRVVGDLAHHPGALEASRPRGARAPPSARRTPARRRTPPSRARARGRPRRPPARRRRRPRARCVGGVPSGGTSPLASETMPGALRHAQPRELGERVGERLRRHGEEHEVGAARTGRRRPPSARIFSSRGSSTPGR